MNARLLLLLSCLFVPRTWAQLEVMILMEQDQFLPGEAIYLSVRVVNHSGQTLTFGEDDDWLRISVEKDGAGVVARQGEIPVSGRFVLPTSKMATKDLNIQPYYRFEEPGQYDIRATVLIKEWDRAITSEPEAFSVVTGTRLWERSFGLPSSQDPEGVPEVRKYLLQQANYLQSQIRLYVRVTDAQEEHTFGVVPVGPVVSFSRPRAVLDADSNLHVLYETGPRTSTYCKISPGADVLEFEKREYSGTKPRLSVSTDGSVSIQGGITVPPPLSDADPQSVQPLPADEK